ncbi:MULTISPECIES: hypothetical protein [Burkholderia]|nr:hypothetical protein [Burkholderia cepacia]MCA7936239.1 hypothetical protein [Burkholderia cepacia]MCA8053339.1 hypothetical protein [Burkholderia cepacia]MCA8132359.1 hypothetical protein [Burkholderia cepacia]MCA8162444.1 hypothetical protein [Burkholderia cepacia]MDN7615548.1 hypothetical protein [Burkholderia cepacia]
MIAIHLGASVIRQELFDDTGTIAPNPLQQVIPVHIQPPDVAGAPCARRV